MIETITDIRNEFKRKLEAKEFVQDKSGLKTIEIVGTSFLADEPIIFGTENLDYINREIKWYNSESLNVNDITPPIPKIWKSVASPSGKINSNYGYLLYSEENGSQLANVLSHFRKDLSTRRAIAIYTRPSMHTDWNVDGMKDFICTNTVQYLLRDRILTAVVNMRSNDLVFGYKNDYAWQLSTLSNVQRFLEASFPGCTRFLRIIWQVGSLHVYERHFKFIK